MMTMRSVPAFAVFVFLTLCSISCKESLPVYQDPRDVFKEIVEGTYVISRTENAMKVYLTIVNKYDETLDARALLTGQIVLTWENDLTFRRTFHLTDAHIISARGYNSSTRQLRLDPGDSIRFGISWSFSADDGRNLRDQVIFRRDPTCNARFISLNPVNILVDATMSLYERTEKVEPPRFLYRFTLVREFVEPRDC